MWFWTGVIPALIVIYIRRNVKESVKFVNDVAKNKENIEKASFSSIFKKNIYVQPFSQVYSL